MKSFLNYAKNRFLYNFFRILVIVGIGFLIGSCEVKADTITSYEVFGLTNEQFSLASGGTRTGTLAISVDDMSSIKPYINILYATTSYGDFTITSNSYFKGSYIEKRVSATTLSGYNADLRILQVPTSGNNWNCSVSGTNCYISTTISVKNTTSYVGFYQVQSVALTDEVLTDDYLDNLIIDKNNQMIEQGQQTNEKLEDLNDTLNDNFNSCRSSVNLFDNKNIGVYNSTISYSNDGFIVNSSSAWGYALSSMYLSAGTYTLSGDISGNVNFVEIYINDTWVAGAQLNSSPYIFTINETSGISFRFYATTGEITSGSTTFFKIQLQEGSTATSYEPYGEEICKNKIDSTNDKLDEANSTSKGIWQSLKDGISSIGNWFTDLGNKIGSFFDNLLTGIINGLKSLFIPADGYFDNWFNDLSSFFEEKLGFLATPFTIVIDFINRYLELDSSADIVINIPDITVPNFEDNVIVHATTFNWSETLKSKEALNTLWQLYLSFVDVYLILNFINFCENKYNRIFGGDTTNYEYYTVEDSYTYDNNTGEVLSSRRNERTTTRKKVE